MKEEKIEVTLRLMDSQNNPMNKAKEIDRIWQDIGQNSQGKKKEKKVPKNLFNLKDKKN